MCCDNEKLLCLKENIEQKRKNNLFFAECAINNDAQRLFNGMANEDSEIIHMIDIMLG